MKKVAILIPARYNSSRFPGKPLVKLDGKPMIQRVVEACQETDYKVTVLTDDRRIVKAVDNMCSTVMEWTDYKNGTERCQGVVKDDWYKKNDYFINVQGDMPDITPDIIHSVVDCLNDGWDVATAYTQMKPELLADPNSVKLIHNRSYAFWFGRGTNYGSHHLGVYGYTREILEYYPKEESEHEKIEKLEQLRWLDSGTTIGVTRVDFNGIEINTPEDVEKWHSLHKK